MYVIKDKEIKVKVLEIGDKTPSSYNASTFVQKTEIISAYKELRNCGYPLHFIVEDVGKDADYYFITFQEGRYTKVYERICAHYHRKED